MLHATIGEGGTVTYMHPVFIYIQYPSSIYSNKKCFAFIKYSAMTKINVLTQIMTDYLIRKWPPWAPRVADDWSARRGPNPLDPLYVF